MSVARALTVVVAAVTCIAAAWTAVAAGYSVLGVAVLAAVVAHLAAPTDGSRTLAALLLLAGVATVVGVVGGPTHPTLGALLLLLAGLGFTWRPQVVLLAGLASGAVMVAATVWAMGMDTVALSWLWAIALVAVAGVVSGQLPGLDTDTTATLTSASRALEEVVALAERLPAGLDRWSVAGAVLAELRDAAGDAEGLPRPLLLLADDGVLFGIESQVHRAPIGLVNDLPQRSWARVWHRLDPSRLTQGLREQLGDHRWLVHRIGSGLDGGAVLVPADLPPRTLARVADVLRPAAVALANVDQFERLGAVARSAAQVRLAHDLHDGVAQALTHVRFELDLVALQHAEVAEELARVRRVADAALLEVRRTVDELREDVPVVERIRHHLDVVRSFASADITVALPTTAPVEGESADELFRLVQEAVSNAVRHADASSIRVELVSDASGLSLTVVDDGRGIAPSDAPGVGRTTMAARADRLGGELIVRARRGGGTVVQLDVPAHALDAPVPVHDHDTTIDLAGMRGPDTNQGH